MDIGRLRTLRELARRGTMAAVAEALLLSPSAVSQQITQLEDEAGLALIERRGRGVRLTAAGELLVARADRIFALLEEARTDLAAMAGEVAGDLRIAAFPSVAMSLIPPAMRRLADQHPELGVVLDVMEPDAALAALRAWQVDVALVDTFTIPDCGRGEGFDAVHVYDDRLFAVLPSDHPFAERDHLSLSDLAREKWAIDNVGSAYSQAIVGACRAEGFDPSVNGYCNGFEVVTAMVEAGCSVSVMPGLLVESYRGNFHFRRIEPEISRSIAVATRRGEARKPSIAALIAAITDAARQRAARG